MSGVGPWGARYLRRLGLGAALAAAACAHPTAPGGASQRLGMASGVPLSDAEAALAQAAIVAARAPVSQLTASARTTRFGSDGRVRVTLQLLVARPDKLRVTVLSPHGPPVWAMACDGAQITALDVGAQAFSQQPATAQGLAHYLANFDLDLDAAAWVALLLGELELPDGATWRRDTEGGRDVWVGSGRRGAQQTTALYDAGTAKLMRASIVLGDGREGTLKVQGRDGAHGLPQTLLLHVGPGQQKRGREPAVDVEVVLSDVQPLPAPPADDVFVVAAPSVPVL